MSNLTRTWLAWMALTIAISQAVALTADLFLAGPSAVTLGVAAGIAWSAATPRALRWIGRLR